jgi:hypothetical protein
MRIQELFVTEAAVPATPNAANPQAGDDPTASTDVRLAAALQGVADLRKQLKTVQDATALSMAGATQQATPATQAPPAPGEAGQGQTAKGPVGPGQTVPAAPGANPQAGQPMGQAPAQGQQPAQAPQGQGVPPPPGITKPKTAIQQDLRRQIAQNQ